MNSRCLTIIYRVPELVFQSIIFLMVMVKFVQMHWGSSSHIPQLLRVFIRDGIWAFAVVFGEI
jgi:hypothetical protein